MTRGESDPLQLCQETCDPEVESWPVTLSFCLAINREPGEFVEAELVLWLHVALLSFKNSRSQPWLKFQASVFPISLRFLCKGMASSPLGLPPWVVQCLCCRNASAGGTRRIRDLDRSPLQSRVPRAAAFS